MHEARIEQTAAGAVAADDGWYIANLAEIAWATAEGGGTWCEFGSPHHRSRRLGIGVHVLGPGETPGFYHAESELEGFLILSGSCIAVIEGQERPMNQWDYFHCPPGTRHITVGTGEEPCAILMFGTRAEDATIFYPADPVAAKYGASAEFDSSSPAEVYAGRPPIRPAPAPAPFR